MRAGSLPGVLYHLKNPFSVLERLAESARYCLLSTAIAAPSKDQHDGFADLPAAFLAGKDGLRGDETNYWFFTEAALRRSLVDRTGWEVCMERRGQSRIYDTGCTTRPEVDLPVAQPQASGRRAFAIIRGLAQAGERRVALDRAALFGLARRAPARIELGFTVPAAIGWPIVLSAGGVRKAFDAPGEYRFAIAAGPGVVEFEADRPLPPDREDGRERGIVVRDARLS